MMLVVLQDLVHSLQSDTSIKWWKTLGYKQYTCTVDAALTSILGLAGCTVGRTVAWRFDNSTFYCTVPYRTVTNLLNK